MKKFLLLIMTLLPLTASAGEFIIEGILYDLNRENMTATLCLRNGQFSNQYSGDIVIPETVTYEWIVDGVDYRGTYRVIAVGDKAFQYCFNLTSVTLPSSITYIGEWAFMGCSRLASITIPRDVTSFGELPFGGCSSLTSITVEEGNKVFDSRDNCNAIIEKATDKLIQGCANTVIPNSVTCIGGTAFYGCNGLTSITIPSSVTSIAAGAFTSCSSLTSITIPQTVTFIGGGAFSSCYSLTSISVEEGNKVYDSRDHCNAIIESKTGKLVQGCNGSTIPSGVTAIDDYAFSGCSNITSITLPDGLTSIGDGAFSSCDRLESISIPNSVTYIGGGAFQFSALKSVVIPEGITSIGDFTFRNCSSMESVTIPDGVTSIGKNAFAECQRLAKVTLPAGLTSIGERAFYNCWQLTSITIPSSVTTIGKEAFFACCLESVSVDEENKVYDSRDNSHAIIETKTNKLIKGSHGTIIPKSVRAFEEYAFTGSWKLTSAIIPEGVTAIPDGLFSSCSHLTSVTLPSTLTSIGNQPFSRCDLKEIYCNAEVVPTCEETTWWDITHDYKALKAYVPEGSVDAYKSAWGGFLNIVALKDIMPIIESEETTFSKDITEETNLSSIVIDNTYYSMDATNEDGYDATAQALVLNSTTTAEQMKAIQDKEVGDDAIRENFNGIIFELSPGSGVVTVDVKTIGTHVLNVQIGQSEPVKVTKSERGTVEVKYAVKEPIYVYLYASTEGGAAASLFRAPSAGANSVLLYAYGVTIGLPGDVNGDGFVTITDAVDIVNYIYGSIPAEFNRAAADLDSDGSVTITDAVKVGNMIRNGE